MDIANTQYRYYLTLWALMLLVLLAGASLFNYLVDPYGLFNSKRIEGFNYIKPAASDHARLAKPYQVNQRHPRTIIAGNSRPEMGINPANQCWPEALQPVYNLSLPGASVYMAFRSLQHAMAENPVSHVFWGLDFKDFLRERTSNKSMEWPPARLKFEDRLSVNVDGSENGSYQWSALKDRFQSAFSLDAIKDSFYTLFNQSNKKASSITPDGYNPAEDLKYIMELEGQGIIFKQKNIEVADLFSNKEKSIYQGDDRWSQEFESVRRFLQLARQHEVEVILFINPYHADYLTLMEIEGWWPEFDLWKQHLTQLSEKFDVELWDFSGINEFSMEQPPVMGDRNNLLQWFWEPSHYRREYGDLMLGTMLQRSCGDIKYGSVGTLLTNANIDSYLVHLRSAMKRYKSDYVLGVDRLLLIQGARR